MTLKVVLSLLCVTCQVTKVTGVLSLVEQGFAKTRLISKYINGIMTL